MEGPPAPGCQSGLAAMHEVRRATVGGAVLRWAGLSSCHLGHLTGWQPGSEKQEGERPGLGRLSALCLLHPLGPSQSGAAGIQGWRDEAPCRDEGAACVPGGEGFQGVSKTSCHSPVHLRPCRIPLSIVQGQLAKSKVSVLRESLGGRAKREPAARCQVPGPLPGEMTWPGLPWRTKLLCAVLQLWGSGICTASSLSGPTSCERALPCSRQSGGVSWTLWMEAEPSGQRRVPPTPTPLGLGSSSRPFPRP